jgi:hypothetical protein
MDHRHPIHTKMDFPVASVFGSPVSVRTSSLGDTAPQEQESFQRDSRAHKKKLEPNAASAHKVVEPDEWWKTNDELVCNKLDETQQLYLEDKRSYEEGNIESVEWEKRVVVHLGTQGNHRKILTIVIGCNMGRQKGQSP